ncbi:MAG: hypothetical protein ABIL22_03255 [candidate division WOR-3 bacterium]
MGYPKILLVFFIILAFVTPANSLVLRTGRDVVIGENEVIDDDLIAMARSVRIEGTVNGDLYAFAQEVMINNIVNGTIYSGAGQIKVNTKNCHSIWAFCGSLDAGGKIEKNLMFFGGQLKTDESAFVNKDLIAFGGDIRIKGEVSGKIKGNMGKFTLGGKAGSVDIQADEAKIESSAFITEDLVIRSSKEPAIDSNAKILGKTEYKKIEGKDAKHEKRAGLAGFFKTIFFFSKLIIGIILIALFKPFIKRTNEILVNSVWKSLGFGFLRMIVIPVVTVITLATIIGIPVAIFGIFVFLTLVYVSGIIFATGFGEWLIRLIKKEGQISPFASFVIGFIVVTLVCLIPYLGFFIRLLAVFFGTGMFVLLLHKLWKISLVKMEQQ